MRVEGDFAADPFWCGNCNSNLDIDTIPLSPGLKSDLSNWACRWGEWIDWDTDNLKSGGIQIEDNHNKWGRELTERVKQELGGGFSVTFSPSTTGRLYFKTGRIQK